MKKFAIRRIITMVILIAAFLIGITLGASALNHGKDGQTIASAFSKEGLAKLPQNTYKATWFIAYYGSSVTLTAGVLAGVLFIVGIVLTFVKGKSFGWIMFGLGVVLLLVALITGSLSHMASKDLTDPTWLAKHLPFAPTGK